MPFSLAIVGRPNVGKSSLFNRIAGARIAIVHDTPGVTRDWKEKNAVFQGLSLRLIDTAGYGGRDDSLSARMTVQTLKAIEGADGILFVIDARAGVTAGDQAIAASLHRTGKPVILAANKCEGRIQPEALPGVFELGFGAPIAVSAEHALGMGELAEALETYAPRAEAEEPGKDERGAQDEPARPLKLALVGRPNVGKSSLFNQLLGSERALTGPEAGLTRDAIEAPWRIEDRQVLLHDTAGLRRRAKVAGETLEEMSVAAALTAIRFADCVILVLDATQPFEKQDLAIADLIAREGRAVVFAVNKWDLKDRGTISEMREIRDRLLPQVAGGELVALSAKTAHGLNRLPGAILAADRAWNRHVPTAELNRFLEQALARHAPPAVKGRRVRIRYMTQPKVRPPTFALFGNQLEHLPEDYRRYLANGLRESFGLKGTPIRLLMRNTKNPYDRKK